MPFHRRTHVAFAIAFFAAGSTVEAKEVSNFGYPFGFSVDKMDRKADPRKDFARYAAGKWIDAAMVPPYKLRVSSMDQMANHVDAQVKIVMADAAKPAATGLLFGHQWHGVAMPGHMGDDGAAPDPRTVSEIAVPEHFRNQLAKEVRPGTTLLLTDYPVLEHTTGIDMAVFSSSLEG